MTETPVLMEPMVPSMGNRELEDRAFDLIQRASGLGGRIPAAVRAGIGDLVRSMNCYYSNLIEDHFTHPRDIERALRNDYSAEPEKRDLQMEAVAHIHVQQLIDRREDPQLDVTTVDYLTWMHREFCGRLPDALLWVTNPETGERLHVDPGEFRTRTVAVGRHVPPLPESLPSFLRRFAEAYATSGLSKVQQVIAVAAAHHRFMWIHPFLDGNGRVARLMAHAWFTRLSLGDSLWSVARGLARDSRRYKSLLAGADAPRRHDTDGRGSLSQGALVEFCTFFLDACIDQVTFMENLLEPATLLGRLESQVSQAIARNEVPSRSLALLREALLVGDIERRRTAELLGVTSRQAFNIISPLIEKGYLRSDGAGAPLRLGFPLTAIDAWFPRLYPQTDRS